MLSILLASYNGEQYIAEQIESLLAQTIQDYKLFICDDNSTDSTWSIIKNYANKYPEKIIVYQNAQNTGGAKSNFINMMIRHKDDYIMLCDQDDVWLPKKIELSLGKIQQIENASGINTPILVYSDLRVVDKHLGVLYESMFEKLLPCAPNRCLNAPLNERIVQNAIAGCTIIYNRALAELVKTSPKFMVMHDWWLTLIASAFGQIGVLREPTILYRQHGNNDTGAKPAHTINNIFYKLMHYNVVADTINMSYAQAKSFLDVYGDNLIACKRRLVSDYSSIPRMSRMKRIYTLYSHKTYKYGFLRKIAQVLTALIERRVRE